MALIFKRSIQFIFNGFIGMLAIVPSVLSGENLIKNGYPTADDFLGEVLQQEEAKYANDLLDVIIKKVRTDYYPGIAKRDEHTKSHGCVDATFSVLDDLPEELRQGLFETARDFNAKLRFSNSSPDSQANDVEKDGRGFAIKLYGVDGDKIYSTPETADQQDFILLSVPFFFINSAQDYTKVIDMKDNGTKLEELELIGTIGLHGTKNISAFFSSQIGSPLEQQYYSAVPYRLGSDERRIAVKYSVKQCEPTQTPIPQDPARNYLRDVLSETLENNDTCLEFMVQKKVGDEMSVEDSIKEWSESVSEFVTVAKIHIPKQIFNTAAQNDACEQMSFDPWNSIPQHKPLGSVNRVRYVVYSGISALRHQMNDHDDSKKGSP